MNWKIILTLWLLSCSANAQSLMIGTSPENPPFSFQADANHFYGFEVDLMNEVCRRLNLKCNYSSVAMNDIPDHLTKGKIDFAIAGIALPATQLPGFVFSLPYLQNGAQFMTLRRSAINQPSAIRNKMVGIRQGSLDGGNLYKKLISEMYDNEITVVEYPTMSALLLGLSNHEVDAIFANELPIKYWYYNHKEIYKLIGTEVPVNNNYSILTSKKYAPLMVQMNHALLDMIADGTYLKIYKRYFNTVPL